MNKVETSPPGFEIHLSPTDRAPAAARQCVDRLEGRMDPGGLETTRLLVSELVTNSVRHARITTDEWISLTVREMPGATRVSVSDPGIGFDQRPGQPQPGDPSGWGLYLVEQLADRWGFSRDGVTEVWFEIDRD